MCVRVSFSYSVDPCVLRIGVSGVRIGDTGLDGVLEVSEDESPPVSLLIIPKYFYEVFLSLNGQWTFIIRLP